MAVVEQQLWNDFLTRWPREKLSDLTLEQYVSVNDDDTFTYWLETKTRELGSIQGNTSAKFGIYKRNSEGKKQSGIDHGEIYTWRNRYGNNESMVFDYVKNVLIQVAQAAYEGDLDKIDLIDFAPLVKWKIAFLYQDQDKPVLINTFSKPMLEVLTSSNNKVSFPQMYQQLILEKGEQDLLEFGDACWKKAEHKRKEILQRTIFDQFSHIELFNRGLEQWPLDTIDAFCSLITEANSHKLDVFTTSMSTGAMIRIGRKELGAAKADEVFATFEPTLKKINFELRYEHRDGYECAEVSEELYQRIRKSKKLAQFAKQYSIKRKAHWPKSYLNDNESDVEYDEYQIAEAREKYVMQNQSTLNQILYGPPGTGKTYHTIEAAVKAAEPEFSWETRGELKAKYDELVTAKRIRFVTFHQSYGYEEFVEGMRAVSNEDKQVEYPVQSGVFKQVCNDALASANNQPSTLKPDAKIWKLSVDGVKPSKVRDYCFDNELAAIGWGNSGDMSLEERTTEESAYFNKLGALAKSSIMEFSGRMSEGDIVVCVKGQWSIQAVGFVSGDYQYREQGIEDRSDFCHVMPVKWLATNLDVNLYALNDNTRLTLKTCYELTRFNTTELYELLMKEGVVLNRNETTSHKQQNYVLVIDEINRGNISKIFGELITLIEPSKRKGAPESIELTLPQSKKPFAVPDNLYLIGTMNTADRSLAMMDTALRRRFDFVEMMPRPDLLRNVVVKGIDLEQLLSVINQRIEILYDREHTLGHAFFMPVKVLVDAGEQGEAFNALVSVFKNKIIPLLEEYFFEDWSKIRLVLADNQKTNNEPQQFVLEQKQKADDLKSLFGKGHNLDQYGQSVVKYTLADGNANVWRDAEAYIGIYKPTEKEPTQSPESQTEANKEPV
ncbi:AAA family ATPase [Vibrio splendidus]|uniref:AAA family ATPase n=1 Tax=Vibrio splendidus TaxID=29497 RepID=UPI00076AA942|nr:AAA family ATPase [Vibrio splendidus]